ncbi:MAG TPA: hypothetical protein VEH27_11820, partial [Methylomirabilota bacterium]|nr:hypothetical protein [Methylomirabilota bacterium]
MSNFLPGYARSFRGEAPPTANQPSLLELAAAVEQMKAGRQIEQLTGQPYRGSRSLTGTYDDLNRAQLLNELNAARSGTSSSSGKRVYGESYGGVESDEISRVNSDRNFDLALLQANEAIKANSFNRAFAQQQAATQTALQNRAMDLNALLQNGRVMAPAMRDMQDAAIRTRTAASAIPDFAAIHQSLSKAGTEFSDADTNLNETAQWIQKMVSNGMLTQD